MKVYWKCIQAIVVLKAFKYTKRLGQTSKIAQKKNLRNLQFSENSTEVCLLLKIEIFEIAGYIYVARFVQKYIQKVHIPYLFQYFINILMLNENYLFIQFKKKSIEQTYDTP